jgi:very-short-patch-repair endonuclease
MHLLDWMANSGGVCSVEAARDFATARQLDALRASGSLWTPLRGWVAMREVRNEVTRALQLGGVVSCVSAFGEHGLWVPHGPQHLHVRVSRETHSKRVERTRAEEGVTMHRMHIRLDDPRPSFGIDRPLEALAVAGECIRDVELIAAADSAIKAGLLQRPQIAELASRLSRRRRRALDRVSEHSGSGSESLFAAMLRAAGIRFTQQPELLPSQFFDFLIGRSLVVEIDSQLWHASPQQQAADRARDAALTAKGYRMLRFTYEQVLFQPDYVMQTVLAVVRQRAHLRPIWS